MRSFSLQLLLALVVACLSPAAHAYFDTGANTDAMPFMDGMVSVNRNDTIIYYGGENATTPYTNQMYALSNILSGSPTFSKVPQTNAGPNILYGQAVISSTGQTMTVVGGANPAFASNATLPIFQFNFATNSWSVGTTAGAAAGGPMPQTRMMFSASLVKTKLYIYGGVTTDNLGYFNDFWSLDLSTTPYTWTNLTTTGLPVRYGHAATVLTNGQIVFTGGVTITQSGGALMDMSSVYVFDTVKNAWQVNPAKSTGKVPSSRADHSAILTADGKVAVFGGDNNQPIWGRQYTAEVAVLDPSTWTWTTVTSYNGVEPSLRSFASAQLYQNKYMLVTFGSAGNIKYNDINLFNLDLSNPQWIDSASDTDDNSSSGVSTGVIVGVAVAGGVVVLIILFLLWKFQRYIRFMVTRIHSDIWKPRVGEPIWAETTRLTSQVILLFVLILLFVFIIRQVIDSPNVTQTINYPAASVDVPDIRFCFDGYSTYPSAMDPRNPRVSCTTDVGVGCNQYVQQLNMSVHTPVFSDQLGEVTCYLFRGDNSFEMTGSSGNNNGSHMIFTVYGDKTVQYGRVHVSLWPKQMDPNVPIYNLPGSNLLSTQDISNWLNDERNDIQVENVYDFAPNTYNTLQYQMINHQYLQSAGWNYVGFLSITNSTPEIDTQFRQESANPMYNLTHLDLGTFVVAPAAYQTQVLKEYKIYSLVNALGFAGGVVGLVFGLQAWLFGYRPRSPWGVVHRWSVGDMKKSLLRGLQSNFKTEAGIPLVHPVHKRFSQQGYTPYAPYEADPDRISKVEERMQVLELLFKAYYVDDEVFRSLDNANRQSGQLGQAPQYPMNEKLTGLASAQEHDSKRDNSFKHMFRQSSGSLNSDTNSQRGLNHVALHDMPSHH
ncbi:hypothetical protein K450DRAFT_228657 [Umbelopsis ramanniana AG]|uniref:Galactose oxidase n=1 Tax=Umbelopsis ramanniana AG TaxID=1314678 RepID=A0AAD5EEG2_UMBRA|nr:uncharacterized protein K450DRAFT_228657 [Umbelopsis ramanniana AG]KAI8582373.1 hypothetical protein K450DRAFT_228657 [Umbelopsis ramanniana AG]